MLTLGSAASAATRTVDTVEDLKTALAELTTSVDVIILQASATPYLIDGTLTLTCATLRGSTDDPRDTVIDGGGACRVIEITKAGGTLSSLTVSNGYYEATGRSYTAAGVQGQYGYRANAIVSNCVITCCRAAAASGKSGYGAGVAHCTVRQSRVCSNVALSSVLGGGVNDCVVSDSDIFDNVAAGSGGGGSDSVFYRCRIFNNTSGAKGGGVCQSSGYTAKVLDHTVVSNNVARAEGGGCDGVSEVRDSEIVFNRVEGTSAQVQADLKGGGLSSCALASNSVIRGNAVVGNAATSKNRWGGAASGSVLVDCPTIRDNYVENGNASALFACTAVRCVLTNNVTSGGSALRKVTATGCTFYGAPVDSSGSTAQVSSFTACRFLAHSNAADAYVLPAGANVHTNGSFAGLGGFFSLAGSVDGFGLYATNCLFAGIDIPTSYLLNKNAAIPVEFVNCTFSDDNSKETVRGTKDGVDVSANVKFVNTMFYRNYFNGTRVSFNSDGKSMTFDHCLFDLPKSTDGNTLIDCVVLPVDADIRYDTGNAEHPYSLRRSSPAVGRGVVADWMDGATDLAGNPRLWDGKVSIGCYEYFRQPAGLLLLFR